MKRGDSQATKRWVRCIQCFILSVRWCKCCFYRIGIGSPRTNNTGNDVTANIVDLVHVTVEKISNVLAHHFAFIRPIVNLIFNF